MSRLDPAIFNLPVGRLRSGYYSDAYFVHGKELLEAEGRDPRVLMQVFQRHESVLGGIDEAIAVVKLGSGRRGEDGTWEEAWDRLDVRALHEGDAIEPWETVMTIEGDYSLFAHLETVYLGCLARRSLVMRNVREVVDAAAGKPILFFPARHDHWLVQTGDGWAAHVAGVIGVSTDAQASWWGGRGLGTVPHALIAAYGGDTVAAARAFAGRFAPEMNVTVLVDFANDSARTAVEVAEALGTGPLGRAPRYGGLAGRRRAGPGRSRRGPRGHGRARRACARGARRRRARAACGSWCRAGSTPSESPASSGPGRRWTPTASAPRCCAARTTSLPTWSGSTGARARRWAAKNARIRGSSRSSDRPFAGTL